MSGFVYLLVCAAALAAHSQAQVPPSQPPSQPGGPGQPGGGQPGAGQPGAGQPGAGQPGAGQPGLPGSGQPGGGAGQPDLGNPGVQPGPSQPNVPSRVECPALWMKYKGSCYRLESGMTITNPMVYGYHEGKMQAMANRHCGQLQSGATLVTVNSMAENEFLFNWVGQMMGQNIRPVWIGLHAGPMGQWQWYSGEPVTYTNWEGVMAPDPDQGAVMFDVQPNNNFNNPLEITSQWAGEDIYNERHFICEYLPKASEGPTVRPALLNNNRGNLRYRLRGGAFGGSQLHEVPRRPAGIRMNPYFNVRP